MKDEEKDELPERIEAVENRLKTSHVQYEEDQSKLKVASEASEAAEKNVVLATVELERRAEVLEGQVTSGVGEVRTIRRMMSEQKKMIGELMSENTRLAPPEAGTTTL